MSVTTQQLGAIRGLRGDGMSIRDIADELNLSKSAVERALKEPTSDDAEPDEPAAPVPAKTEAKSAAANPETYRLKLEHERAMKKLDYEREELEVRKRELAVREREVDVKARQAAVQPSSRQGEDKTEARKTLFLNQYNRLTKEFFDNCQDSTWDTEEVDDYVSRLEDLQERIEKFCDAEAIDHEELAIWVNVDTLIEGVTEQKEEQAGGFLTKAEVDFDLSDEVVVEMQERYELYDFEAEYVERDDEDLDEDEDDEDDDEDQDEDIDEDGDEEEEDESEETLRAERRRWL